MAGFTTNGTAQRNTVRWHKRFGSYLLAAGLLDEDALYRALKIQGNQSHPKTKIGKLLIEMGLADDVNIAKTLAFQLNIDFVNLKNLKIAKETLNTVPAATAANSKIIPIFKNGRKLTVAMANPLEQYVIDDLRFVTRLDVNIAVAPESEIIDAIERHYTNNVDYDLETEKDIDAFLEVIDDDKSTDGDENIQNLIVLTKQAPVVKFTNHIIANAIKLKASDIHIEPRYSETMIRYRIDGIMREIFQATKKSHFSVVARIKIIASMDISVRRKPQDGRARIKLGSTEYDLRVSSIPTSYGEKLTIRILDPDGANLQLDDLGFPEHDLQTFKDMIHRPQGLILVTGPTGSGKSTTLYACLNELNTPEVNIITVEDPVEYDIAGVNQVQINPKAGITFASGLRSILRQDPDIVMVGEIRDKETAAIAFQASQTGHLVFSTLHTNDAPSVVTRLVNMGIEPYLISVGLTCVIGQRLVRKLCPICRLPDPKTSELIRRYNSFLPAKIKPVFWISRGCDNCHAIGYNGRIGVYEIMKIGRTLQETIVAKMTMTDVRNVAESEGYKMLAIDGLHKAIKGFTSYKELERIVSIQNLNDLLLLKNHNVD